MSNKVDVNSPGSACSGFDSSTEDWNFLHVDSDGMPFAKNMIWNTSTLAWEKATGSLSGGSSVTVNNFPATQVVSGTVTADGTKYAVQWRTSGSYVYVGEAAIGSVTSSAVWRCKKIDTSTGAITWAASGAFSQIFNNYASLTYA